MVLSVPGLVAREREVLPAQRCDVPHQVGFDAEVARAIEATPATLPEADFVDMMRTNALSPVRAIEILEVVCPLKSGPP